MSNSSDENRLARIVILAIIVLGLIITVSRTMFPLFAVASAVFGALLIFSIIRDFLFRGPFDSAWSVYPAVLLLISLIGAWGTYSIGYGFGNSDIGQMILRVNSALGVVSEAEQNATDVLYDASKKPTQELCRLTNDSETCKISTQTSDLIDAVKKIK